MKKTVILFSVLAVLLVGSGQVFGCSLCESLKKLGYSNREIVSLISGSATRAEAEERMRQVIRRAGGSLPETVKHQPLSSSRYLPLPQKATVNVEHSYWQQKTVKYRFSEEEIDVPPMKETAQTKKGRQRNEEKDDKKFFVD